MTKQDVLYQIVVKLSRPPFLEDLINIAAGKQSLESLKLESTPYARVELARVLMASSYEAVDKELMSILEQEISEIKSKLPRSYRTTAESLRELFILEDIPSRVEAGDPGFAKYTACRGRSILCYISTYITRVREEMERTREDPWSALSILAALLYGIYTRHAEGLKVLGLKHPLAEELEVLRGVAKGPGAIYYSSAVEKIAQLASLWIKDPIEYFASEAKVVYEASKTCLYFRGGLLNVLTHFFITRYYESKLLRIIASRRVESLAHA